MEAKAAAKTTFCWASFAALCTSYYGLVVLSIEQLICFSPVNISMQIGITVVASYAIKVQFIAIATILW